MKIKVAHYRNYLSHAEQERDQLLARVKELEEKVKEK